MLRHLLSATALMGTALIAGCAQTGEAPPVLTADPAATQMDWRPFSAESPWNTKIAPDAKIDPDSDALTGVFADLNPLHINMPEWSVAVYYVDQTQTPKKPVQALYPDQYGTGFGPDALIPIPDGAKAAGPDLGSGYLAIVDRLHGMAWEMRQAGQYPETGGWFAGYGAKVDLRASGVNAPWMEAPTPGVSGSPRPSGAPLLAGLIRVDEIKSGRIDHALAFAYPAVRTGVFVAPASTALEATDGREPNPFGMPMGTRIQLNPDYDIDQTLLSPEAKIIARALQEYGAILVDEADGTVLFAESGPEQLAAWEGVLAPGDLQLLFTPEFMSLNFRVLEIGTPMPGKPRPGG